jgi:hypothetical protein
VQIVAAGENIALHTLIRDITGTVWDGAAIPSLLL